MYGSEDMPSDKMMTLFIIQSISSFVAHDYDSGLYYLNEIKTTFAQSQSQMNPTLKKLAKEIIKSLDMFTPGSTAESFANTFQQQAEPQPTAQPTGNSSTTQSQEAAQPRHTNVASELQDLLNRRRARKGQ